MKILSLKDILLEGLDERSFGDMALDASSAVKTSTTGLNLGVKPEDNSLKRLPKYAITCYAYVEPDAFERTVINGNRPESSYGFTVYNPLHKDPLTQKPLKVPVKIYCKQVVENKGVAGQEVYKLVIMKDPYYFFPDLRDSEQLVNLLNWNKQDYLLIDLHGESIMLNQNHMVKYAHNTLQTLENKFYIKILDIKIIQ